ncbi:MAG TPA: hypothetical protein VFV35_06055 [Acidimicrobiales bacterium]|nr:hypothetical protein [Acidimicrobiales bacterium]
MERKAPDREIDARIEALARRQHGALARRQAIELGASAALVQRRRTSKRWRLAAHGVYVLAGWPPTFHQRVAVAVLRLGPDAFAAASCAAMLRNLDGIDVAPIEIATPRPPATPPKGITVRRALAGAAFDDLDGIPTATATEIVVQLAFAPDVPFSTLESVFECAQRRKLTTHAALAARMAALSKPGVTGVQAARARLRLLIDDGAVNHSELETRFFQLLREEGLPLPERERGRAGQKADGAVHVASRDQATALRRRHDEAVSPTDRYRGPRRKRARVGGWVADDAGGSSSSAATRRG